MINFKRLNAGPDCLVEVTGVSVLMEELKHQKLMISFWQTNVFLNNAAMKGEAQKEQMLNTNYYARTVVIEIVKSVQTNLCRSNFINMQSLNV